MALYLLGGLSALALGCYFVGWWFGWQMGVGTFFVVLGAAMLNRAFQSDTDREPPPRSSWREPET